MKRQNINKLLVSLALGDGHITRPNKSGKSVLCIRHSTHQKDYIEWKYKLIPHIWRFKPRFYKNCIKNKKYYGYYLRSKPSVELADIHKKLYPNNQKTYNLDILNTLDPLGLAIWYMDDGCIDKPINKNAMGILNTYGKSLDGNEELLIQYYFKKSWNIDCRLNKNHGKYRIRFNYPNFCKLINLIKPYIIQSLKYKINIKIRFNTLTKVENSTPKI